MDGLDEQVQQPTETIISEVYPVETYFIGWGGLAIINAAIANVDGRGPLKYFLGSLFAGPFVTILLAATREGTDGGLRQVDVWKGRRAA